MPALDAVLFLTPRSSQVDVVQSVGRVMRKAPGKELRLHHPAGRVPAGVAPEEALSDNKRYKVVWQVLQALRSHDDRFHAMSTRSSSTSDARRTRSSTTSLRGRGRDGRATTEAARPTAVARLSSCHATFDLDEWRDAMYARIVEKVGDRAVLGDVGQGRRRHRRSAHHPHQRAARRPRVRTGARSSTAFLDGLRGNLNDRSPPTTRSRCSPST